MIDTTSTTRLGQQKSYPSPDPFDIFLYVFWGAVLVGLLYLGACWAGSEYHNSKTPDVLTPVTMTGYLKAAGFDPQDPSVKVAAPTIVPAGHLSGGSSAILGTGSGKVEGDFEPGIYYPASFTIEGRSYAVVLNGAKQLVADATLEHPEVSFKDDPVLTNYITTDYRCWRPVPLQACTVTTYPAYSADIIGQLKKDGAAMELIMEHLDYLRVPPSMMPAE